MRKSDYWQKLKDPRWQKKRLEVLDEHGWMCEFCGSEEDTLHVHHFTYMGDADPWEYDNCYLGALCEVCHKEETEKAKEANRELACAIARAHMSSDEKIELAQKMNGVAADELRGLLRMLAVGMDIPEFRAGVSILSYRYHSKMPFKFEIDPEEYIRYTTEGENELGGLVKFLQQKLEEDKAKGKA